MEIPPPVTEIVKFPGARSLTEILARLSPEQRLQRRRRIEAIAWRWTERLTRKYGSAGALAVCRRKLVYCIRHAPGLRETLWNRVYRNLRPAGAVRDDWRRDGMD